MKFDPAITAERIMSIPDDEPGMLFSSAAAAKDEYRALAKIWHPDMKKARADEVFPKIGELFAKAELWAVAGIWTVPGTLELKGRDGKTRVLRYKRKRPIDVGTMYYGETILAFVIDSKHVSHYDNGTKAIRNLKYADSKMQTEISRFLPKVKADFTLEDGRSVLVLEKTADQFLLRDVIEQQGGKLDPKHAAWVTSRLLGLSCYLEWAQLAHNSITVDTIFISPEFHSASILGGWWFSKPFGQKMLVVPKAVHDVLPSSVAKSKLADNKTDRLSIRALGREIAGDRGGMSLKKIGVPDPMANFLRGTLGPNPFEDNFKWHESLEKSFGPKRFTVLDIPKEKIYER